MYERVLPYIISQTPGSYQVRIEARGERYHHTFNHKHYGSYEQALSEAVAWRDRMLKLLRPEGVAQPLFRKTRQSRETTVDRNGVHRTIRRNTRAAGNPLVIEYVATFRDRSRKPKARVFRVGQLGLTTKQEELHAERTARAFRRLWEYCTERQVPFDTSIFIGWRDKKIYPMTNAKMKALAG